MTDPRHAFEREGQGRYYRHPVTGEELVSVTNALSNGMAKYGLPLWYAKNAAEYAMENLPTLVQRSRTDREGALRDIKAHAETVRDKAANLGTRVHALAEAHVLGKPMAWEDGDHLAEPFLTQYLQFLKDFDVNIEIDVVASEMSVAHPVYGYAGTLDLICKLPLRGYTVEDKRLSRDKKGTWLIDLKTSSTRASTQTYPENALQLTALHRAREMWLPDDTVAPMLKGITGCAVLNLRQKTYKLIPLPTRQREWDAFRSVLSLTQWLHGDWPGQYDYRPVKPSGLFEPKRGTTSDAEEKVA